MTIQSNTVNHKHKYWIKEQTMVMGDPSRKILPKIITRMQCTECLEKAVTTL